METWKLSEGIHWHIKTLITIRAAVPPSCDSSALAEVMHEEGNETIAAALFVADYFSADSSIY